MKRILLIALGILALQCSSLNGYAQRYRKADKWYAGAHLGLNSKTTHNRLVDNTNASASIRLGYEQTRFFGYMGEVTAFFGDVKFGASKCMVKAINADLMAVLNFSPLFSSSLLRRSLFEARLFGGFGINHICGYPSYLGNNNDLISKLGLDFGFNVGARRDVYLFLQPAINYNMDHFSRTQYNINYSALQVAVGAHYRFSWNTLFRGKSRHSKKHKGQELAASETVLTRPEINPSRTEVDEAPVAEKKPEVTAKTPVAEKKPEVKPEVPVEEKKPEAPVTEKKIETKPVTPATKDKAQVTPKAPVTEKKAETKPVTPATKDKAQVTPKAPVTEKKAETKPVTPATKDKAQVTPKAPVKQNTPAVEKKVEQNKTVAQSGKTGTQKTTSNSTTPKERLKGLTEVATFLRTHPKSTVVIRGDQELADEARIQLIRRYSINPNRISVKPEKTASQITFEVEI